MMTYECRRYKDGKYQRIYRLKAGSLESAIQGAGYRWGGNGVVLKVQESAAHEAKRQIEEAKQLKADKK